MSPFHRARAALACLVLAFAAAHAAAADTVRPEVGKPLKEAEALLHAGRAHEALAKIRSADAIGNKTPYENLLIEQLRGSAALAAGDNATAIKSFESVLASGKVTGKQQLQMVQAIAVGYYKLKEYANAAKWTQRYFKEGGGDPAMRTVLLQSYFLSNDCAAVSRMLGGSGEENGGRKPSEEELQILANCYLKERDTGGYVAAIERLVLYYPKKEYWTDLLARVQKKPGFSDRLSVHVYRLRFATGNFASANDYMEFAQLALQEGLPAEAKIVIDKGYASGALGKGAEAARENRLRELVQKTLADAQKNRASAENEAKAAHDGNDLVKLGAESVYEGNADQGLAMMEQGIKKGGLRRPEDAKLLLGEAQLHAGHRNRAVQTLKSVHGNDGAADIARLWVLQARA